MSLFGNFVPLIISQPLMKETMKKRKEPNQIVEFVPSDPAVAGIIDEFFIKHLAPLTRDTFPETVVIAGGKVLSLLMGGAFKSKDWDVYFITEPLSELPGGSGMIPEEDFHERCSLIQEVENRRAWLKQLEEKKQITIIKEHPKSVMFVNGEITEANGERFIIIHNPNPDEAPEKIDLGDSELIELIDKFEFDAEGLLMGFDLNISRCAYIPAEGKFYVDEGLIDFLSGEDDPPEIEIIHATKPLRTLNRIAKYQNRGFPINPEGFQRFMRYILAKNTLDKLEEDLNFFKQHGFEFSDSEDANEWSYFAGNLGSAGI